MPALPRTPSVPKRREVRSSQFFPLLIITCSVAGMNASDARPLRTLHMNRQPVGADAQTGEIDRRHDLVRAPRRRRPRGCRAARRRPRWASPARRDCCRDSSDARAVPRNDRSTGPGMISTVTCADARRLEPQRRIQEADRSRCPSPRHARPPPTPARSWPGRRGQWRSADRRYPPSGDRSSSRRRRSRAQARLPARERPAPAWSRKPRTRARLSAASPG